MRKVNSRMKRRGFKSRVTKITPKRKAPQSFARRVKQVMLRNCEPKIKYADRGKTELYHNSFHSAVPGAATGLVMLLNSSTTMPAQDTSDQGRIGDQIRTSHYKIKMLIGQKSDRPNVSFRYYVLSVPKGSAISYANWFIPTAGNVLLDDPNPDFVKTIKQGVWRPNQAGLAGSGGDEFTFVKRLHVPYKRLLKFGPLDAAVTHNDNDLWFVLMAYDAYGTLVSDNIAYIASGTELHYKDP